MLLRLHAGLFWCPLSFTSGAPHRLEAVGSIVEASFVGPNMKTAFLGFLVSLGVMAVQAMVQVPKHSFVITSAGAPVITDADIIEYRFGAWKFGAATS